MAGAAALLMSLPALAQPMQQSAANANTNSNSAMMNYYFGTGSNTSSGASAAGMPAGTNPSFMQGMQTMMQMAQQGQNGLASGNNPFLPQGTGPFGANPSMQQPQQQPADLGSITDPTSPKAKAGRLGIEAERQRTEAATLKQGGLSDDLMTSEPPPPDVTSLQNINQAQAGKKPDISDDVLSKEIALDMRKSAQKEAALSYGARGGLAKRNYEIMERMRGFDTVLDRVFNFRSLLIKAPSGLLIEPPIIKESSDALVITEDGNEAAVAEKIFDINKKAKIVSAPRDWRQYLIQSWSEVPPPPHVLWPRTPQEQAEWSSWVEQGWTAGLDQADQIFEMNVNRLVAEYNGMVRYRMLLAQGMISAPYAMHEDRGIVGDGSQMRVGDRAIRITGPSQFLTKAELWKPADR